MVKAVSEQVRRVKPKIKISAAVFRNWAVDRDGVGQDWKLWCERGYLDFVCPMDYTESDGQFDVWVRAKSGGGQDTGLSGDRSQFVVVGAGLRPRNRADPDCT